MPASNCKSQGLHQHKQNNKQKEIHQHNTTTISNNSTVLPIKISSHPSNGKKEKSTKLKQIIKIKYITKVSTTLNYSTGLNTNTNIMVRKKIGGKEAPVRKTNY